uniref:Prothymosin alpha-like n=1 Tax=Rhabditophanes sp. KR3021 TaxID=114890 RepID=A0AC35UFW7_9BILA
MATLKRKNEDAIIEEDNAKVLKIDEDSVPTPEKENEECKGDETVGEDDALPASVESAGDEDEAVQDESVDEVEGSDSEATPDNVTEGDETSLPGAEMNEASRDGESDEATNDGVEAVGEENADEPIPAATSVPVEGEGEDNGENEA